MLSQAEFPNLSIDSGSATLLLLLAALAILPFLLTMVTSFAKLVVVGSILRQALGTQHIPPTSVITGLALILTIHIMYPHAAAGYDDFQAMRRLDALTDAVRSQLANEAYAAVPRLRAVPVERLFADASIEARDLRRWMADRAPETAPNAPAANALAASPKDAPSTRPSAIPSSVLLHGGLAFRSALKPFLTANSSQRNVALFGSLQSTVAARRGGQVPPADGAVADLTVLVPAFVLTELGEAFLVGFLVFVPFLVIDLVVSSIILALGMQTLNPISITLPLKLLLFVLMDGWTLVLRGLVLGYQ